ncbi:hypothetical protein DFH11DRAFT_1627081, partial [Phellopilus nigrolimitatus]
MEALETQITHLYASRYLTIAGTTVLVYDTILTLPDEIKFVWSTLLQKRWRWRDERGHKQLIIPKILLLFIRYTMLTTAIAYLSALIPSRTLNDKWCQSTISIVSKTDVLVEVIGSGIVLYRLYLLWDFGRLNTYILVGAFISMKAVTFTSAIAASIHVRDSIHFQKIELVQFCDIERTSALFYGVWVPGAVSDAFSFFLLLLNALSRPRTESERLLGILYSDGIVYFLTTFSMRLLNVLFVAIAKKDSALFYIGTIFSGTTVTVAASRSFLRLLHFGGVRRS